MTRYRFAKVCHPSGLLAELLAAGVRAGMVNPLPGATEVDLEPEDFDRAATVVAAHDAAAYDAAEEAEQDADDDDRLTLRQVHDTLLADALRLEDTATTLSAQQVRNHVARCDRALAGLLRVLRRRGVI
jgi:uncharacterized protein YdgA (DUF945 family)